MKEFQRPFTYLIWKENLNEDNLHNFQRLKGIHIPDTVVITKAAQYISKRPELSMDWFFYSKKQGAVLRRHWHNVSLIAVENYFLKMSEIKEQKDKHLESLLVNRADYRLLRGSLAAIYRRHGFERVRGPGSNTASGVISRKPGS